MAISNFIAKNNWILTNNFKKVKLCKTQSVAV